MSCHKCKAPVAIFNMIIVTQSIDASNWFFINNGWAKIMASILKEILKI